MLKIIVKITKKVIVHWNLFSFMDRFYVLSCCNTIRSIELYLHQTYTKPTYSLLDECRFSVGLM